MIRLTKVTDYGIVILSAFARSPKGSWHNASDLAQGVHLPQPIVSKILKILSHEGLLNSHRGVKGGYQLINNPEEITVTQMINVLDGPLSITECSHEETSECAIEELCLVRKNWDIINHTVQNALEKISLADLVKPASLFKKMVEQEEKSFSGSHG